LIGLAKDRRRSGSSASGGTILIADWGRCRVTNSGRSGPNANSPTDPANGGGASWGAAALGDQLDGRPGAEFGRG